MPSSNMMTKGVNQKKSGTLPHPFMRSKDMLITSDDQQGEHIA
jgi:hypothetical protein